MTSVLKVDMLQPPKLRRLPGRPTNKRKKDAAEKHLAPRRLMKKKFACRRCTQIGHNSRTCSNQPVKKIKKSSTANKAGRSSIANEEVNHLK